MNDESLTYIATLPNSHRPERINRLLERRMKDFLLARRRKLWQEEGI